MASPTRRTNRATVLSVLLSGEPISRQEVVRRTGLSTATVFRIVDDLRLEDICVDLAPITKTGRGRNATAIGINRNHSLACGIDLGGTNCRIVLTDPVGLPVQAARHRTPTQLGSADLANWIADRAAELRATLPGGAPLAAVAVGVPGVVANDHRTVVSSHNLGQIVGTEFTDTLAKRIKVPVRFDNDSNLALLGEMRYGTARGKQDLVLFVLGTGLGVGVALGGKLLTGHTGVVGEFGRLPMPGTGGTRLRQFLSGAGLVQEATARGLNVASTEEVFEDDSPTARHLVEDVLAALRHLVATVGLAYEPETIMFAGGFSEAIAPQCIAALKQHLLADTGVVSDIHRSALPGIAGSLGSIAAALIVLHTNLGIDPQEASNLLGDLEVIKNTVAQLISQGGSR